MKMNGEFSLASFRKASTHINEIRIRLPREIQPLLTALTSDPEVVV
jgi:hypothetical protein